MAWRSARSAGLAAVVILGSLTHQAAATQFSFASSTNGSNFTFAGMPGSGGQFTITDATRPNRFTLVIDDDNGPAAPLSIPVEFRASFTASQGQSVQLAPTLFQHSYRVTGTFGFYSAAGEALLTAGFGQAMPALLTIPGSQNQWSSTGAVLGADSFTDLTYTATTALATAIGGTSVAAQYGILLGSNGQVTSAGPDDFAFDVSVLTAGGPGINVTIDPTTKVPTAAFNSESSFSGSANLGIPAPGTMALLGAGFVIGFARRRSRA